MYIIRDRILKNNINLNLKDKGVFRMKATMIVTMILNLFIGAHAFAQAEPKAAAPQKVDTKNIEEKYWQPSDQSYSVVQSRTYAKEKKFGVSLLAGPVLMDQYAQGFNFDAALSYYFTERWGVELQGSVYSLSDNEITKDIVALGGSPDFGRVKSFYGMIARWVPFYSKMSFMGTKVVYFDMSFGLGVGLMNYEQFTENGTSNEKIGQSTNSPAVQFDISQTYFINPKFAVRVDYKMRFFNEEILAFNDKGSGELKGDVFETKLSDVSSLNVGVTYYF